MDGKRAGIALVLSLVVACGGAAPTTSGAGASSAAIPAAAASVAASAASTAKPSTAADAGPQLAALLSASKLAQYKITYKITGSGSGAEALSGDQTWYFKPPRTRFDFAMSQGGQKITISFFTLPEGSFYCFNAGQVQCLGVGSVGSPLDQNASAVAQRSLVGNPAAYGATASSTKTIAGQQAQCFDVTAKAASAFDSGTFCYSKDGVPLLSSFSQQYSSWSMEATNFSATVPDSDFTLPATPVGR